MSSAEDQDGGGVRWSGCQEDGTSLPVQCLSKGGLREIGTKSSSCDEAVERCCGWFYWPEASLEIWQSTSGVAVCPGDPLLTSRVVIGTLSGSRTTTTPSTSGPGNDGKIGEMCSGSTPWGLERRRGEVRFSEILLVKIFLVSRISGFTEIIF